MKRFSQLRWRIIGAHMLVVVVGVVLVMSIALLAANNFIGKNGSFAEANPTVLAAFRNSLFTAVFVGATGAIVAGLIASFLLAEEILRPLRAIVSSSRRIARGHYQERVAVPASDELAEVATNFNQMAESLEQVEQQRVTLIGNVSHELRTPLTGLNGYVEGLMDGVFPQNEETYAMMQRELRRLRRLVDDLQSLSRVESGRLSLTFETFDLIALVERAVSQLRPQAEAACLQVVTQHPDDALFVYADRDRTIQVLLNLIGNGIQHTPEEGCITVTVTSSQAAGAAQSMAHIEIQDTGAGIPATALPYLFERFYRVDASRNRQSGGSGIGLTISRHLVWGMGGEITAVSDGLGKGSLFTFTLPTSAAEGA